VPKHVAVVKDLFNVFVSTMNTIIHVLVKLNLKIAGKGKFDRLVAEIFSS